MRIKHEGNQRNFVLEPGEHYVSDKNVIISTLLGSCVSACLYDPVNRIIGMNHFLLSNRRYKKSGPIYTSEAGRYGIHAMELVINGMMKLGANRKYLKAKAFGGGSVLMINENAHNMFAIGEINVRFIKEFLITENIPLVSSDLGGQQGRIIRFLGGDYAVYVKTIEKTAISDVVIREKNYWKSKLESQESKETEIQLWS